MKENNLMLRWWRGLAITAKFRVRYFPYQR